MDKTVAESYVIAAAIGGLAKKRTERLNGVLK